MRLAIWKRVSRYILYHHMVMIMEDYLFSRTQLLLGEENTKRLSEIRVIVFGVGGVGSWCAECLVRTGVHHLTIVDNDKVCASNINRQLMATSKTIGCVKVDVLRQRLNEINPSAQITAMHQVFNEATADQFELDTYDYVIDAIDSLKDKAELILRTTQTQARLFSSMGAALKLDPTRIQVGEFWKVHGDPLARALRNRFKREGTFPKRKFKCVFSDELLKNRQTSPDGANGSLSHITAVFGFTLAGLVIQDVVRQTSVNTAPAV